MENGATYHQQCWGYDSFGNRTGELATASADTTAAASPCPTPLNYTNGTHWAKYNSNNYVTGSDTMASGPVYDAAGNVTQDAVNKYAYDSEGRLCAVQNLLTTAATQYIYDAEGRRVAKGSLSIWPAVGSACAAPTAANGFTLTATYLRGAAGTQDAELDWSAGTETGWHQNVYADGGLLATYTAQGSAAPALYFSFNDWLGTKRLEIVGNGATAGQMVSWWSSDPFGNYLATYGAGTDATEHHFTGKERDAESGNDYFMARYYSSAMGRFLSPDWSAKLEPVPYAKLDNPQSLNLYSYVLNNPLSAADPDGHETPEEVAKKNVDNAKISRGTDRYDVNATVVSNGQVFKPGSDKCNLYVSETMKNSTGEHTTVDGTGKIPSAAAFADPNVKITGLSAPEPMANAKPGDVIAQDHGANPKSGNEEGHVGIVVSLPHDGQPGQTASANANEGGKVTINDWGFRSPTANPNNGERSGASSPAPVVRHPLGDQQ